MKLHLIAIGQRMPAWVVDGYQEYAGRLPRHLTLNLKEIPLPTRGKNPDIPRLMREEGSRMLDAVPAGAWVIALDGGGKPWSTQQLSEQLGRWMQEGRDVALLVGGPDGLDPDCLRRADQRWSLGPLTLPHPLVRIILAEQLYRAFSILQNHPYHRA